MKGIEKICTTCHHLDGWGGDCCHPEGDGARGYVKSIDNCLHKDRAWWEPSSKYKDNIKYA